MAPASSHDRPFPWYDPRAERGRLVFAALLFVVTGCLGSGSSLVMRLVAAWDAAGALLLALMWSFILRADAAKTQRRAAAEDPGRRLIWVFVLIASIVGLFSGAFVLPHAKTYAPDASSTLVLLSLASVATAWLLTHTSYALRYAHLYYRDHEGTGGLEFPGGARPDDFDFAYFAFTIGMCFQVSDVTISNQAIRRNALIHAVISFAYNTVILTTALNFAVSAVAK